ncbi:MAG: EndoU domain-containing protein [Niveispirillum sp.]|uniref:EndoU domain-containing protein n=1 Tax=Niveispirillum sp. TaxID=1917217 RepID=UPI004035E564
MAVQLVRLVMLVFSLAACGAAGAAEKPSCEDESFGWSQTNPSVNLRHVLCGEVKKNGDVVGMHSRAIIDTAPVKEVQAQPPQADGVYSTKVFFENGKSKNSTFYPDNCGVEQVTNSILYAVKHSHAPGKPWGKLGCSAPAKPDPKYCTGPGGERFVIRFAEFDDGRINTAFPQMGESCPQ